MSELNYWIDIQHADVLLDGEIVLRDITCRMHEGERWGIFGSNGSGKSTLLRLIRGELWPAPSSQAGRTYRWNGDLQNDAIGVREQIGYISSEFQDRYLQQEWNLSCLEIIATGFFDTPRLYQPLTSAQQEAIEETLERLQLDGLTQKSLLECSRGEARKILIARALVHKPKVLILDECCNGLDEQNRTQLLTLLERIAETGISMVYASHREDEIPSVLTHRLDMQDGKIKNRGPIVDLKNYRPSHSKRSRSTVPKTEQQSKTPPSPLAPRIAADKTVLISIENTNVWLENQQALHGIDWQMRANENWAVLGANGSGKTTFLRLLYGEVWPEWGGRIVRFDSSDDDPAIGIKQRMGVVSSDLQALYTYNLTAEEVVQSGFFASIGLYEELTRKQISQTKQWMAELHLTHLAQRPIRSLSYGELRKVLIARGTVHHPDILLFDEPCDGLDEASRTEILETLNRLACERVRIVMTTHHLHDLFPAITHVMEITQGRITTRKRSLNE